MSNRGTIEGHFKAPLSARGISTPVKFLHYDTTRVLFPSGGNRADLQVTEDVCCILMLYS